jgi:hypothetical protein
MYNSRDSDVQTCAMKAIAIFKNLRQQWCQCLKMDNDSKNDIQKVCDNSDIEASKCLMQWWKCSKMYDDNSINVKKCTMIIILIFKNVKKCIMVVTMILELKNVWWQWQWG